MTDIEIPFSTERYERRLIIFIDLIGFKNYVLSNYREGNEADVKNFTAHFQHQVCEGAKYIKGKSHSFKPSFNFFSDTIVISLPLELFNAPDHLKTFKSADYPEHEINIDKSRLLCFAIIKVSEIQFYSLQNGLLTRGCLTVGDIYHNQNTWFGPGIIDAYEHESKIAIYPRVILSKSAFEYFENEIITDKNSSFIRDSDGFFYVNYIAWVHKEFNSDFCDAHCTLREIIVKNLESLRSQKMHKELQKWEWLAFYFNKYTDETLEPTYGSKLAGKIII